MFQVQITLYYNISKAECKIESTPDDDNFVVKTCMSFVLGHKISGLFNLFYTKVPSVLLRPKLSLLSNSISRIIMNFCKSIKKVTRNIDYLFAGRIKYLRRCGYLTSRCKRWIVSVVKIFLALWTRIWHIRYRQRCRCSYNKI